MIQRDAYVATQLFLLCESQIVISMSIWTINRYCIIESRLTGRGTDLQFLGEHEFSWIRNCPKTKTSLISVSYRGKQRCAQHWAVRRICLDFDNDLFYMCGKSQRVNVRWREREQPSHPETHSTWFRRLIIQEGQAKSTTTESPQAAQRPSDMHTPFRGGNSFSCMHITPKTHICGR